MLQDVSLELGLNAKRYEWEAALYGPKLDFMFKDALGREIQIPTVQLDFATPKSFDLTYVGKNGEKSTSVMVHRAILGSYERFLVLLLEQFKGILPIWLSPVQVQIIPVNIKYHDEYCKKLLHRLLEEDIRAEYDNSNESMGKKIRQSNIIKNPITVIIGDSMRDNDIVSFKKLGSNENVSMSLEAFVSYLKNYIKSR